MDYSPADVCLRARTLCARLFLTGWQRGRSSSYYALAAAGARYTGGQSDNSSAHKRPNAP